MTEWYIDLYSVEFIKVIAKFVYYRPNTSGYVISRETAMVDWYISVLS